MKLNEWRFIIIKNSNLCRIRRNFRLILEESLSNEIKKLSSLRSLYTEKRLKNELTRSQSRRLKMLHDLIDSLIQARYNSILNCSEGAMCISVINSRKPPIAATIDKDKVWNPILRSWICIDCYINYYITDEKKESLRRAIEKEMADIEATRTFLKRFLNN